MEYRNRLRGWLSGLLTDLGPQLHESIDSTGPVKVVTENSQSD